VNADPKQPLNVSPEERVTLDQIKRRAEAIGDRAVSDSKRLANEIYEQNVSKTIIVAVGVVLVAASLAYFLGTRAGRRAATPAPPHGG
jgi:hypothetical protein